MKKARKICRRILASEHCFGFLPSSIEMALCVLMFLYVWCLVVSCLILLLLAFALASGGAFWFWCEEGALEGNLVCPVLP